MSLLQVLRKGFSFLLMSMGVSASTKKPASGKAGSKPAP